MGHEGTLLALLTKLLTSSSHFFALGAQQLLFDMCSTQAGVAMKPNSVFMHIAYSNFLLDVRHNAQAGWSHLEMAKKLEPNLSYQFSMFSRHQEHKQKSAGGGGGEGSTDLVSYVEFQKNYRLVGLMFLSTRTAACALCSDRDNSC